MPNDLNQLIQGLNQIRVLGPQGLLDGLKEQEGRIQGTMQQTTAHGDQTGATRASYYAAAVGLGETGAAQAAEARAAAEALNPGHSGSGTAEIAGVGLIISSGTDYQEDLETDDAGEKAVLAPTLQAEYLTLTAAAARGSKRRIG